MQPWMLFTKESREKIVFYNKSVNLGIKYSVHIIPTFRI